MNTNSGANTLAVVVLMVLLLVQLVPAVVAAFFAILVRAGKVGKNLQENGRKGWFGGLMGVALWSFCGIPFMAGLSVIGWLVWLGGVAMFAYVYPPVRQFVKEQTTGWQQGGGSGRVPTSQPDVSAAPFAPGQPPIPPVVPPQPKRSPEPPKE